MRCSHVRRGNGGGCDAWDGAGAVSARHESDRNGFLLWRQLGLPSVVVVNASGFRIEEMIEKVE